jgi:hypothetical protein
MDEEGRGRERGRGRGRGRGRERGRGQFERIGPYLFWKLPGNRHFKCDSVKSFPGLVMYLISHQCWQDKRL